MNPCHFVLFSEVKGLEDEAERLQQCLITMMEAAHVHQQSLKAVSTQIPFSSKHLNSM